MANRKYIQLTPKHIEALVDVYEMGRGECGNNKLYEDLSKALEELRNKVHQSPHPVKICLVYSITRL